MRFGFHVSIAGGFRLVPERAERAGCETIQLFTRSPRGWRAAPLDPKDAAAFRQGIAERRIAPVFVHAPYLPNLAAAGAAARRTVAALRTDCERAHALGLGLVICHAGRANGASEADALRRVSANLDQVLERTPESVTVLLENTAGMGTETGFRFEQLARVIERVERRDRVGVMLDTCHAFAAGYELRTRAGLDRTLRDFDRTVGLGRLHGIHLNDSKYGLGVRKDRHWHIGRGEVGRAGMKLVINHPLLAHLAGVMETPRRSDNDDLANLRAARRLQS